MKDRLYHIRSSFALQVGKSSHLTFTSRADCTCVHWFLLFILGLQPD